MRENNIELVIGRAAVIPRSGATRNLRRPVFTSFRFLASLGITGGRDAGGDEPRPYERGRRERLPSSINA